MDCEELRRQIETFRLDDGDLGSQGYERVLLQLFGYMGHGKSSFINSCKYVLHDGGPFVEYAEAGQKTDGGSMTMIRKDYQLTPNITIVDNRGFRAMTDFERTEVYAQLGNFYPLNKKVEWKENFDETMSAVEESELNPNYTDFLVPVFIYSGKYTFGEQEKEDVKSFLDNCVLMTGIFPVIVITHKNGGDFRHAERMFEQMGGKVIIGIENYTKENNQKNLGRNADMLKVIDSALRKVRDRLEEPRDPKRERIERKKFILNYIHGAMMKHETEQHTFTPIREEIERGKRAIEIGEHVSITEMIRHVMIPLWERKVQWCTIL